MTSTFSCLFEVLNFMKKMVPISYNAKKRFKNICIEYRLTIHKSGPNKKKLSVKILSGECSLNFRDDLLDKSVEYNVYYRYQVLHGVILADVCFS